MADRFGDKIGPRLAELIGQYVLAARRDHAPIEAQTRLAAQKALVNWTGTEVAGHFQDLIALALEASPDMPPHVRDYLTRTASGRHQWQAVSGALSLSGAGSALSEILSNFMAPAVYRLVSQAPNLKPDIGTIATFVARGHRTFDAAATEAAELGYDYTQWNALVQAAFTVPDLVQAFDAVNRGALPEFELDTILTHAGVPLSYHGALKQLRKQLLSPADAALAVLRTAISPAAGQAIAAANGVDPADFAILLANTGEPPGAAELGEGLRRGFIDQARFERGIRQSRIRDEWLDLLLALRYAPMSTADAIDAAVQNHLSVAEARAKASQNGLEPADFDALLATAGEPLSRTESEELLNRGEMTIAEVEQALRESRLKDKYVPFALKLHVRLPPERTVVAMISHGVITHQRGTDLLLQLGYSPQVAAELVAEGSAAKLAGHKELTVGEIRSLYTEGVFSKVHAGELLGKLGYDKTEADYLIAGWDLLAAAQVTRQAVAVVRSRYVARRFDWPAADGFLHTLGLATEVRARYQQIWNVERDATTRGLTEAQIVAAHKKALISGAEAGGRLVALGYTPGDARLLLGVKVSDPWPTP